MHKAAQTTSLLAIVFFGFVGLSLPYPIFSPLFLSPDSPFTVLGLSSQLSATLLGLTLAAYPLGQFLGSPILGSLSDRFGRKRLLILTLLGTGVGYVLSGWAISRQEIGLLIFTRLLTGFFEGNMGIAQAAIADLKHDKYFGLGAVAAASSLGYLVGPLIGGFLCDPTLLPWFNFATPFYAGSIMAILLILLVMVWFKETHKPVTSTHSLLAEFNIAAKLKRVYHHPSLRNAFIAMFLLSLSIDCYYEFYPAFLVETWEMTPKFIGLYSATLSLALTIGSLWLPQWLHKWKNPVQYRFKLLMVYGCSLALLLFAANAFTLNLHFFVLGLSYSAVNTIQTVIISDNAGKDEQGAVMGLQWGTRMLGDAALCIFGSFLLWQASFLPIILAIFLVCATLGFLFWNRSRLAMISTEP